MGLMEAADETVTRVALGDSASLGDLYNARTDKFCGLSLLKKTIGPSSSALTSIDNPFSKVDYVLTDSFSEKMSKLNLSAELKVSFLAGLVSLEGSGKYLKDDKTSARSVRNTLNYSTTTKTEKINLFGDEMKSLINMNLLEDEDATHVVTEITWGANLNVVIEYKNEDNEDVQEIGGSLKAHMQKFGVVVDGAASVDLSTGDKLKNKNFSLKVYGDIVTSGPIPKTIEEAQHLICQMPCLISQSNDGKGKPVSILLTPISKIRSYFALKTKINTVLYSLEEGSILQVIRIFDEILSVKQNLNDLVEDLQKFRRVLPSKAYGRAQQLLEDLESEEAGLKAKLKRTLIAVRSGDLDSDSIYELINKYKRNEFSAANVQLQVDQEFDKERSKIDFFTGLSAHGVKILEKGQTVNNLLLSEPNCKWYVFYKSEKVEALDKETLSQNQHLFLETLRQNKNNHNVKEGSPVVNFLFVDLEISPESEPANFQDGSIIQLYENGKQISGNLLQDHLEKSNKSVATCSTTLSVSQFMPPKRTHLKVRCPGSINGQCKNDPTKWECAKCEEYLEFGFDSFIYCSCGRGPYLDYEYRCSDTDNHGAAPLKFSPADLDFQLKSLRPFKEFNILLLGETGVGKSTWINGFANYLSYPTLAEAEQNEMHCLIHSSFQLFDENNKEREISMGKPSNNEIIKPGASATQRPTSYTFPLGDMMVRVIDTPGIGDTRGLEQDKKNFSYIIDHLSKYNEIHGICILLKPNQARVTVIFEFCIKELLAHLHRDAINNIVFCFTNARSTFYQPGDSYVSLDEILRSNSDTNDPIIPLSRHTVYCMDNEAIRFLAAVKQGIKFPEKDRECFVDSWEKAVDESRRILEHFNTVNPHKINDTVSLNQARQSVTRLSRPLADISRSIQNHIDVLDQKQKELNSLKNNEAELRKKLYVPSVVLEPVNLDRPRTVCTAGKCVESRSFASEVGGGIQSKTNFKQICHNECGISGTQKNQVNCAELQGCACMDSNKRCTKCGCSWEHHMHITYETIEKTIQLKSSDMEREINKKLSAAEQAKKVVDDCQKIKMELENEQETINKASAKFAYFLRAKAITYYNDAIIRYMDQLIEVEEGRAKIGGERTTLEGLKRNREMYSEEIRMLDDATKDGVPEVTVSKINEIRKNLFELTHNGETIKKHFSTAKESETIANQEVYHAPKIRKKGGHKKSSFWPF